jgi:hypothetical protein
MANNFNLGVPTTSVDNNGNSVNKEWFYIFNTLINLANSAYQYGPTSQRPTTNLYVGMPYFDQTLGYSINLKTIGTPNIWVNGSGSSV